MRKKKTTQEPPLYSKVVEKHEEYRLHSDLISDVDIFSHSQQISHEQVYQDIIMAVSYYSISREKIEITDFTSPGATQTTLTDEAAGFFRSYSDSIKDPNYADWLRRVADHILWRRERSLSDITYQQMKSEKELEKQAEQIDKEAEQLNKK